MSTTTEMLAAALDYAERGWDVFPAPPGEKKSHKSAEYSGGAKWGKTRDPEQIRKDFKRWPMANVGIPTGAESGFWVIEADTPEGHDVDGIASLRALEEKHGPLPTTLMAESPSGSLHYYFKWPDGIEIRNTSSGIAQGIDVRGEGGMVIAPPSVRGDGAYRWLNDNDIAEAPQWLIDKAVAATKNGKVGDDDADGEPQAAIERICAAFAVIPNEKRGWDDWNRCGLALFHATGGSDDGLAIFHAWSSKSKKYDAQATDERWAHHKDYPPTEIGAGSIFHWADEASPAWEMLIGLPLEKAMKIAALASLSIGEYETKREAVAEEIGYRKSVLDDMVARLRPQEDDDEDDDDKPRKQADVPIALSARAEELFHAPDGTAFVTIPVDDHFETWPVRSRGFKRWLSREFFNETKSAANSDATQSALNVIEARAHFDGVERDVYIRVGAYNDRLYLDLADKRWRVVEIDKDGWRIIDRAPIPFRRSAGMRTLPDPVHGGKINELRQFLNINKDSKGNKDNKDSKDEHGDDSFVLAVSFGLAALRPRGPYPVLGLAGEHGTAKSTFTSVLRLLIDPNSAPLRALPREDRDLFIAANNAHLLAFDNISNLPDWISDTLCRLATGGGFATRSLYSDMDETLFDATRPVILNGIEDIVIRPDLADRSMFLILANIADDNRKAEKQFWSDFEAARPRILGALLDGVAHGLLKLPTTKLARIPRMADFALWGTACETAYWDAGTFMRAYGQNRDDAVGAVIEADNVATAVQKFMDERPDLKQQQQERLDLDTKRRDEWTGTAANLLDALKMAVGEKKVEQMERRKEWPGNPRGLSARLRRAAGTLRKVGIEITFDERESGGKSGGKRPRKITITKEADKEGGFASPPSDRPSAQDINDIAGDGRMAAKTSGAPTAPRPSPQPSPANPLKNKARDGGDGRDAKFPPLTDEPSRAKSRSDDLPYEGPVVEVPEWPVDPLDEHGASLVRCCSYCGRPGGNRVAMGDGTTTVTLHRDCEDFSLAGARKARPDAAPPRQPRPPTPRPLAALSGAGARRPDGARHARHWHRRA
jgi:hypothetical protein